MVLQRKNKFKREDDNTEWLWPLTWDMWASVRLMCSIICRNAPLMPLPHAHHYEESSNLDQIKSKRRTAGQRNHKRSWRDLNQAHNPRLWLHLSLHHDLKCFCLRLMPDEKLIFSLLLLLFLLLLLLLLNAPTKSSKSHVEVVRHTRTPPSFHMLLVFDEKSHIKSKTYSTLGQICVLVRYMYIFLGQLLSFKMHYKTYLACTYFHLIFFLYDIKDFTCKKAFFNVIEPPE